MAGHQSLAEDFAKIDMTRVWLEPFLSMHRAYQSDGALPLANWLNGYFEKMQIPIKSHAGQMLHFTDQNDLPHGVAYEKYIGDTNKIPTRDNLHDWFGACIWAIFPKCKAMLNRHHLRHLDDSNTGNGRNRVRDAITVFDENGIIVVVSGEAGGEIGAALCRFDWQNALVLPRRHWEDLSSPSKQAHAKAFIFGHALLEQLIDPRKNLCGHALIVTTEPSFFGFGPSEQLTYLDDLAANQLDHWLSQAATPRDLQPLPVLGVPHFWDEQNASFYQDKSVFREGRRR